MILSHRAPSSLNMSSYRAIWTHFRHNFIFLEQKILGTKILVPRSWYQDPGTKILVARFTMGSQVHDGFWEEVKAARSVALNF